MLVVREGAGHAAPMPANLQILSLTRFAYPGLGGFQRDHDSVEARQAALWAPERLEKRFRSLEHVCLTTLALQTDPDFRALVITGDTLPEPWRTRLQDLCAAVPQVELVFHPPENQRDAMEAIVNARIDPDGPPVLQFRQDDDDGVGRRFVERARQSFAEVEGLWARHGRLALDFNRGFALGLTPDGLRIEPMIRHHLGVAHALFLRPDIRRTAIHFPHHRIATLMPCVSLTDAPMWLRGIDGSNDSPMPGAAERLRPATPEELAELRKRFGISPEAIAASF